MTAALVAALVGLSLIDSTSFGTLLIPIWLLLTPGRVRVTRLAVYLGTVVGFYFVVGLALVAGADTALTALTSPLSHIPTLWLRITQLAVGAGLIALSYWLEARLKRNQGQSEGRLQRWRAAAVTESGGSRPGSLVRLATLGTALELVTMLPYLVAIGLLASADLSIATVSLSLAGYCLLMVAPAIALTAARTLFHDRIDPALVRMNNWLTRNSAKAVGWTIGGIGIAVALNAVINLVLIGTGGAA